MKFYWWRGVCCFAVVDGDSLVIVESLVLSLMWLVIDEHFRAKETGDLFL